HGRLSLGVSKPDFVFFGKASENGPLHGEKSPVILKSEAHLFERTGAAHTRVEPRVACDPVKGELRQQVCTRRPKLGFLRLDNCHLCKQVGSSAKRGANMG